MIILVAVVSLWIGLLIGSLSAAKLVKNQMKYEYFSSSKPLVKENMFPYNWEDDDKFLAIIDEFKKEQ